jgi:tRNA pseudouridine32 synthase/23S rRNA pseudouridine746 synthase
MQRLNDGKGPVVPPSRLYLPKLESPPATILEHLIGHFPQVSPETWRIRIERRAVTTDTRDFVTEDTPYVHGMTIFYRKEVVSEPDTPEEESILYMDDEILVADKPHGMVVTPVGDYVERSLLVRLQRRTGLNTLVPAHRLDRETAGVVLLSVNPETRPDYHALFADGTIEREYRAVAHLESRPEKRAWRVENRIEAGEPWYRGRIVDGTANAVTDIELIEAGRGVGLFRIRPQSGKKHQIRLHMASIGFPIVGDRLYPDMKDVSEEDSPLQLLAHRLAFPDPLNGESRNFQSARELVWN